MVQIWANRGLTTTLKCDILIHYGNKNTTNSDFKALWYKKMIDLAVEYKLMDYVMKKGLKQ